MLKTGLVLEGGGFRGVYTSGVLDFFLEKGINFQYLLGVSAGACNALGYISRQPKLNFTMATKYIGDRNYISINNLVKTGSIFNMEMLFDTIPNKLENFDKNSFKKNIIDFIVPTTDCKTGKPMYFKIFDYEKDRDIIKASSSLPLVSQIVKYGDNELLDGGLSDPIPIKKSVTDGNQRHVVVLTQSRGFREKPAMLMAIMERKYASYPKLLKTIRIRHNIYNESLEYVERLEKEGSAVVLRPSANIQMSAIAKDKRKLNLLYETGYIDAQNIFSNKDRFTSWFNKY